MSTQEFRPVGELDETGANSVVIERRDPDRWQGLIADAVDSAIDDGETTFLMEDGRVVAVVSPYAGGQK